MKIKLANSEIYDLNFSCDFFRKLEDEYKEVEISMYEDIFLDLNSKKTVISLLEKYDLNYLVQGLLYFGAESELENLSTYLQKQKIEAFFERHLDKVSWRFLSENPSLSETFFERHIDKVCWPILSGNHSLSEAFFEKYIDEVNWAYISWNTSLSEAFFEKYIDKVNWWYLFKNSSLSEAFFEKYIDKIKWISLSKNPSLSETFFEKHIDTSGGAGQ